MVGFTKACSSRAHLYRTGGALVVEQCSVVKIKTGMKLPTLNTGAFDNDSVLFYIGVDSSKCSIVVLGVGGLD